MSKINVKNAALVMLINKEESVLPDQMSLYEVGNLLNNLTPEEFSEAKALAQNPTEELTGRLVEMVDYYQEFLSDMCSLGEE